MLDTPPLLLISVDIGSENEQLSFWGPDVVKGIYTGMVRDRNIEDRRSDVIMRPSSVNTTFVTELRLPEKRIEPLTFPFKP